MKKSENKKVVIWGHPIHSHTHSYIHYGFYKALKHLEYDVEWVDDCEDSQDVNLENAIVITENNCSKFLPIIDSAKYLIHNLHDDFVETGSENIHNLLVYHENYSWDGNQEQIDDYSWFDSKTKTSVIMWASDLLPREIELNSPCLFDDTKKDVFYVGTIGGKNAVDFAHVCANNGKNFYNLGGYTGSTKGDFKFYDHDDSMNAIRESFISFDIREECHINNGYIPCRLFKNISYGKWTGSNSKKVEKYFDGYLTIEENLNELYQKIVNDYSKCDENKIKNCMKFVQENHTYINRVNSIFSIL